MTFPHPDQTGTLATADTTTPRPFTGIPAHSPVALTFDTVHGTTIPLTVTAGPVKAGRHDDFPHVDTWLAEVRIDGIPVSGLHVAVDASQHPHDLVRDRVAQAGVRDFAHRLRALIGYDPQAARR